MPGYCAPWPGNRNASFGGDAAAVPAFAGTAEFLDQAAPILGDSGEPLGETAPSGLQGEGDVADVLFRVRFEMCREAATGFRQGIVVAGRQDKQMRGLVIGS